MVTELQPVPRQATPHNAGKAGLNALRSGVLMSWFQLTPRQEKENRKEWMAEKNTLQEQAGNIYGSCYKTVVKMNAEDAYGLY